MEYWVNVEYAEISGYSRVFGPYPSEKAAFNESLILADKNGRPIYDYDQVELDG